MTIKFWMNEEHVSAALAAGTLPVAEDMPSCALVVGDTISFPGFRNLAYRVKSRHYRSGVSGEPQWLVELEPSKAPF